MYQSSKRNTMITWLESNCCFVDCCCFFYVDIAIKGQSAYLQLIKLYYYIILHTYTLRLSRNGGERCAVVGRCWFSTILYCKCVH